MPQLGEKLRTLRKRAKLTLTELAQKTGMAEATISRIETGKIVGRLESHRRICEAFGLTLAEFYADLEPEASKVARFQAAQRTERFFHDEKSAAELLTKGVLSKKMMPVLIRLEPGGKTHLEEAPLGTERFVYVLEGHVTAAVNHEHHGLKAGDSLYFDASIPHQLENAGQHRARCLCVTTPPVL